MSILSKPELGCKPKYEVGDIVESLNSFAPRCADDTSMYWFIMSISDEYAIPVHSKCPRFAIMKVYDDHYYDVCEIVGGVLSARVKVSMELFEGATSLIEVEEEFEVKNPLGGTMYKCTTFKERSGIRKYKRAIRLNYENLEEIIALPFVKAIIPNNAYDDGVDLRVFDYDGTPKKSEIYGFSVKTILYDLNCNGGYFVQDACDGWRWLSDEGWEKHKDDLITE